MKEQIAIPALVKHCSINIISRIIVDCQGVPPVQTTKHFSIFGNGISEGMINYACWPQA